MYTSTILVTYCNVIFYRQDLSPDSKGDEAEKDILVDESICLKVRIVIVSRNHNAKCVKM